VVLTFSCGVVAIFLYIYFMIKNAIKTVVKDRSSDGVYVEFSKVEIPLDVKKALFDKYDKIRPKNVDISDEEIQKMANEVRYGNKYGKIR